MKVALADIPERQESIPANIVMKKIDPASGLLGEGLSEYFIKGTEPTKRYVVEKAYSVPASGGAGSSSPQELF